MPRRSGIGGAFQSLAQSSAKRRFQARRHPHLIKNGLGGFCPARFQYFRQRRHFRCNACAYRTGFGGTAPRLYQCF
jgi:hypothetical protein